MKFNMKLNDNVYTFLKWITLVVIPTSTTAYVGLSAVWGWPFATEIAKTSAVICSALGALLGISTAQYNKSQPIAEDADMKIWPEKEVDD